MGSKKGIPVKQGLRHLILFFIGGAELLSVVFPPRSRTNPSTHYPSAWPQASIAIGKKTDTRNLPKLALTILAGTQ